MKFTSKFALAAGFVLAIAGLGASFATAAGDDKKPAAVAKIGEKAPAWTLKDTKGTEHKLADFAGKTVVLEWYNDKCPACVGVYESGAVAETLKQLKEIDPNIVYLAVNSTANQPKDVVIAGSDALMKASKLEIPILIDYEGTVGKAYDARTTPHMFVIDKEGVLRYHGAFSNEDKANPTYYVVNAVKQLKAGETVTPDYVKPWGCSVKYAKPAKAG